MSKTRSWSWIPLGIMVALLLSLAVAGSFRDRAARAQHCTALYAEAATADDSARVDTTPVPAGRAAAPMTCGEVVGR